MNPIKLLIVALFILPYWGLNGQAIIQGQIIDEHGEPPMTSLVKIVVKASGKTYWTTDGHGTFKIALSAGNHTLIIGGQAFMREEKIVELNTNEVLTLDIRLNRASPERVRARVPLGDISDKIIGEWRLVKIEHDPEKKRYSRRTKIKLQLKKNEWGFGNLSISNSCRGKVFELFFQQINDQSIQIYDDYQMEAQTSELRRCDKMFRVQKEMIGSICYGLADSELIDINLSKNKRKLILEWQDKRLVLKR